MTAHTRKRSQGQGKVLRLSSFMQKDAAAMHNLINRGPSTMVFVFSTTCPHCHTYMPIWKRMCQLKGRKANMISMEASTYKQTPISQGNPVSGVPAVLHVDQNGKVTPVDNPRDTRIMKTYVRNTLPSFTQVKHTQPIKPMQPMLPTQPVALKPMKPMPPTVNQSSQYTSSPPSSASRTYSSSETVTPSPLKPLPARGGNWSAMMAAAASASTAAAPAAALLGAYAAFPMQRSSGLGPARKTRKRK